MAHGFATVRLDGIKVTIEVETDEGTLRVDAVGASNPPTEADVVEATGPLAIRQMRAALKARSDPSSRESS